MALRDITWIATTPAKPWAVQGAPLTTRKGEVGLRFDGLRDQTWEGFGGGLSEIGWTALSALRAADREKVIRALFHRDDGCRLTFCRVPLGASDYAADWYSGNETPDDLEMRHFSIARDRQGLIPYLQMALRYDPRLRLLASPWSPPVWMKDPPACGGGRLVWKPEILEAYALYFARFIQAYRHEGFAIRQVHVQNEATTARNSPSCVWTGAELRDFIRNHLGPMFAKQRVAAEIWLGTLDADDYDGYPLTVLSDPLARQYIAGIGGQWTGGGAIPRLHAQWPETRIAQFDDERGDGLNTWAHARAVFGRVRQSLVSGANAYVHGHMALPAGGAGPWGGAQNSLVTVDPDRGVFALRPEFYLVKHFSYFIRRDAVRLGLSGEWADQAVAFLNPDESRALVVANPSPEPRRLVLEDRRALLTLHLPPESFNTVML